MDVMFGGFIKVWTYLKIWGITFYNLDFSFPVVIVSELVILLFLLGISGAYSAMTAEVRGYDPRKYFFLGMLMPVLYPMTLKRTLKPLIGEGADVPPPATVKTQAKAQPKKIGLQFKTKEEAARDIAELKAEIARKEQEAGDDPQKLEEVRALKAAVPVENMRLYIDPEEKPTKEFCMRIALNPDGTAAGPFLFTLTNASELEVLRIVNPLDDVLALEIPPAKEGEPVRQVRIPYTRLASVRFKD